MAIAPGTLGFEEIASSPPAPPVGFAIIYIKTDNILYIKDSGGAEVALGSASAITGLTGEVTATGPGTVPATVSNAAVIAKVLTGFTPGPNSTVLATDTILQAFQKLQAQVTAGATSAITALTGDVTATGPGSVPATVAAIQGTTVAGTTGTGNVVFSNTPTIATPTVTGLLSGSSASFSSTIAASNFSGSSSGTNTGDVSVTDTNSIDLTLAGQNVSADLKLSADAASSGNVKSTTTVHTDGLHIENPFGTPVQIGTSNNAGAASSFALSDHVHSHGNQTSATLHAVATTIANGFMSSTDKTKLDTVSGTAATDAQILISNGTTYNPRTVSGDATITNTGAVTVTAVGGSTAAAVNSATVLANNSTASNTASQIVRRDANGNAALGVFHATTTKTANYTITAADDIIFIDTSGGAFNLTLPNPSTVTGKIYKIIGTSGTMNTNPVTLVRFGSEMIEGLAASKLLQTNWGWFQVVSNGTNWFVG